MTAKIRLGNSAIQIRLIFRPNAHASLIPILLLINEININTLSFSHRVVPLDGNEEAVTLPTIDLKEGEMVKADGDAFKAAWLNDDKLKVKFIITSYSYN